MNNLNIHKSINNIDIFLNDKVKVYYGIDILDQFASILMDYNFDKIFFITEQIIYDYHGRVFVDELKKNGIDTQLVLIKSSEKEKSFHNLETLCNHLIENNISKDSIIISFGGGIIGNISGLAANLIYRGIRYIEIPTTFMGQTDSTLSNKQAINGGSGKNQIGSYYAPLFVWSDIKYSCTESPRHIKAAIVEGIKNTLIHDKDLIDMFKNNTYYDLEFNENNLLKLFETIVNSKNKILKSDPSEKKYAIILEYGHTFGHAIEFLTEGKIIHGEAVAMGMCIAAEVSYRIGGLTEEEVNLHYELLKNFIYKNLLDNQILNVISPERIYGAIQKDNKRTSQGVKYVLLATLGECMNPDGDYQVRVSKDIIISSLYKFYSKLGINPKKEKLYA